MALVTKKIRMSTRYEVGMIFHSLWRELHNEIKGGAAEYYCFWRNWRCESEYLFYSFYSGKLLLTGQSGFTNGPNEKRTDPF